MRGPVTLTGLKHRCRATMGRCQGGFCGPKIAELLTERRGIALEDQTYKGPGTDLFAGALREEVLS